VQTGDGASGSLVGGVTPKGALHMARVLVMRMSTVT